MHVKAGVSRFKITFNDAQLGVMNYRDGLTRLIKLLSFNSSDRFQFFLYLRNIK